MCGEVVEIGDPVRVAVPAFVRQVAERRQLFREAVLGQTDAALDRFHVVVRAVPARAEAYLNKASEHERAGEFDKALAEFQVIGQQFPTAGNVADSMYRIARLQRSMGDVDAAKATLQRLVNTYPGTTMAGLARDLLAEIG